MEKLVLLTCKMERHSVASVTDLLQCLRVAVYCEANIYPDGNWNECVGFLHVCGVFAPPPPPPPPPPS